VRHLRGDVERPALAVQRVEIFGKAFPLPIDALGQGGAGDIFDTLHQADQEIMPVGAGGRETDAAIAHQDSGDAMPERRRQLRIPGDLAVIVGMDVDPAGRDQQAVGMDRLACRGRDPPDLGDAAVLNGDIGDERSSAAAVDDSAAPDDPVVHGFPRAPRLSQMKPAWGM
jgi:hypothetical protein